MNQQNPTETPLEAVASDERSSRNPFKKKAADTAPTGSKADAIKRHAKTGLAVVGGLTLGLVAVNTLAKKRGVDQVEVTLPDINTNPEEV